MSSTVRVLLGVVLTAIGGIALAAALVSASIIATVWMSLGSDARVSTTETTLVSGPDSVALVVEGISARVAPPAELGGLGAWIDERGWLEQYGTVSLVVADPAGQDLFAGEGSAAEIDGYLAGVAYSVALQEEGGQWVVRDVPGAFLPPAPESTDWIAQARGNPALLPLEGEEERTIVIVNADRRAGVSATLGVSYGVGGADAAAYAAIATTLTALVIGVGLLIAGPRLLSNGFRMTARTPDSP